MSDDGYRAFFPIFILICEHQDHARFMRSMLDIAEREAIAITTQDRRDAPDGNWKPLRGYNPNHARWLHVWEAYGEYWCSRGDESPDWHTPERVNAEAIRQIVERHRQEQRVFK